MKKKFDGFSYKLARRLRTASYLLKRAAMMIEREAKDGKDADGVRVCLISALDEFVGHVDSLPMFDDDLRSYITPDEDED